MSILDEFYEIMKVDPIKHIGVTRNINIPHSSVFYIRAVIERDLGTKLHVYEVERILYEEGMLPAKDYGIPAWYRKKYGIN